MRDFMTSWEVCNGFHNYLLNRLVFLLRVGSTTQQGKFMTNVISLKRLQAVQHQTGLVRSSLYALIKLGKFPAGIKITGARAVGWPSNLVDAWVNSRIAASTSA
jgi:prophage regulatory protein